MKRIMTLFIECNVLYLVICSHFSQLFFKIKDKIKTFSELHFFTLLEFSTGDNVMGAMLCTQESHNYF